MKTVRICFSKTGRAKFISHLDLNRVMLRAVRRAGIPLWYTEGFNRHPYLTFAAPLSLGYEGLREFMDLRLEEEMPLDELAQRLDAVMPEGLSVLHADEACDKPGDLDAARYRLTFSCNTDAFRQFLQQPVMEVQKRTKKKTMKTVDIKPALADVRMAEQAYGTTLEVTLPCNSTDSVNPHLLLTALQDYLGDDSIACQVVRLALYAKEGKLFA